MQIKNNLNVPTCLVFHPSLECKYITSTPSPTQPIKGFATASA